MAGLHASTSSTVTLLVSFTGAVPGITVTPVSGTSTGIIVGGIIAAILRSAGILAAVVYFLRKCRGRQDEAFSKEFWNPSCSDACRQFATLGADAEPVRPYSAPPRPPSMIERHLNNTPSMPPRQPTLPNDVMASPVSGTVPEYYDASHPGNPAFLPQALTREPPIRTGSVPVTHQNLVTGGPFSPVVSSPDAPDPHYTDLSRSSVALFQAAQYAEITEKLGGPMSSVLGAVSEERQAAVSDNNAAPSYDDPSTQEIHVPERSFSPVASLEFPVPLSVRSSPSAISAEFSDLRGPPPSEPNHKSSPLATSTPMRAQEQPTIIPREPKTGAAPANRPDTVYTVYDEEDAPMVDSEHQACLHITIRYVPVDEAPRCAFRRVRHHLYY
ncbi:hypothetical protein EDB85DRAFT_1895789 [Lactarius pseudohatsudake]|nr:hypothetical protein EDB85DRAFT_1895789 [Lactarius pseudohatsudake]